ARVVVALIYEGLVIALASLLGWAISDHYRIIPTSLIHFPAITVPAADFKTVAITLVVANLLVFAIGRLIDRGRVFIEARRTSFEIYGLLLGFTLASIF